MIFFPFNKQIKKIDWNRKLKKYLSFVCFYWWKQARKSVFLKLQRDGNKNTKKESLWFVKHFNFIYFIFFYFWMNEPATVCAFIRIEKIFFFFWQLLVFSGVFLLIFKIIYKSSTDSFWKLFRTHQHFWKEKERKIFFFWCVAGHVIDRQDNKII